MSRTQVTIKRTEVNNWEECDVALKEVSMLTQTVQRDESEYNQLEQEQRALITAKHAPLKEKVRELEAGMRIFCEAHRDEFGDKKSKELNHGIVSFRQHPPAVEKLAGTTWKAVMDIVKASKKWAKKFIRVKEELDKDAIMSAYSTDEINGVDLAGLALKIEKKESFGYDLKLAMEGK